MRTFKDYVARNEAQLTSPAVTDRLRQMQKGLEGEIAAIEREMEQAMQPYKARIATLVAKQKRLQTTAGGAVESSPYGRGFTLRDPPSMTPAQRDQKSALWHRNYRKRDHASLVGNFMNGDERAAALYYQAVGADDGQTYPMRKMTPEEAQKIIDGVNSKFGDDEYEADGMGDSRYLELDPTTMTATLKVTPE